MARISCSIGRAPAGMVVQVFVHQLCLVNPGGAGMHCPLIVQIDSAGKPGGLMRINPPAATTPC